MVDVRGFRGVRYNPDKVDIEKVVTPPYDIISNEEREMYYAEDPHNAIRLILNKPEEGDNDNNNQYTRAKAHLEQWLQEGVLMRDTEPAIYAYEQEFTSEGQTIKRMGFIGAGKLHEYEEGVVIPHERTLSRAKGDRFKLMTATGATFGLIFMLYHDPGMAIDKAIKAYASSHPPTYEAVDAFGVKNKVWMIKDKSILDTVHATMGGKKLYIADGHHRYETAVNYRNKMREEAGPGDWDYRKMMFVNMKAPGLIIFPTYRWIKSFPYAAIDFMLDECMDIFEVHPLDMTSDEAYAEMEKRGRHNFLVYDERYHILSLRNEDLLDKHSDQTQSKALRAMDVSILHKLILERHLGIDQDNLQDHIKYTRDRKEAIGGVDSGEYEAVIMMNPPTMQEFIAVADVGEKMPQKSTYFYPKIITGLVFNKLDGKSLG